VAWPGCGLQGTFGPWRWRAPQATAAGASTQTRLSSSPSMMGGGGGGDDAKHGGERLTARTGDGDGVAVGCASVLSSDALGVAASGVAVGLKIRSRTIWD
jgi:hypothetical protein